MSRMITSSSNSLIKHVRLLHKKKIRWESKNFFVEGLRSVKESIISHAEIEYFLYSDSLFETKGGKDLFSLIDKNYENVYNITDKLLKEISDTQNPQGIIAVVRFNKNSLNEALKERNNFLILLDRVQDPGNMGTIIRTADALGANGILITSGCVDPYNPKTIRATMGSIFHIPLIHYDNVDEVLLDLKKRNIEVISTGLESSRPCYEIDFTKDFVLVIGNEASGISERVQELSDTIVKIPMQGRAESLNAAIASGIVMYEASRQRQNFLTNSKN